MTTARFPFAFDARYRSAARLFGVTPQTAYLEIDEDRFLARFGRWVVDTPLSNILEAETSGPYSVPKTIGPARLSVADRGLTFATNAQHGVCLTFREPVSGIDPLGAIRHPGLTVTVADPAVLVARLNGRPKAA